MEYSGFDYASTSATVFILPYVFMIEIFNLSFLVGALL
jgi:hypothetical protein